MLWVPKFICVLHEVQYTMFCTADLPQAEWHPDSSPRQLVWACSHSAFWKHWYATSVGSVWIGSCPSGYRVYQSSRQAACLSHFPDVRATDLGATRHTQQTWGEGLKWLGITCKGKSTHNCEIYLHWMREPKKNVRWRIDYSMCRLSLEIIWVHFSSSPVHWLVVLFQSLCWFLLSPDWLMLKAPKPHSLASSLLCLT